jgi:hypothetical protein
MKDLYYKIGAGISAFGASLIPFAASAQLDKAVSGLEDVGSVTGADQSQTLPDLVGNLINILLSVVGIILVVLLIYAGFLYMTAQGDSTKVDKAKDMMKNAIIGLVIIVSAYAISSFVISALVDIV